jgi:endo-1,4-beta-xylanase
MQNRGADITLNVELQSKLNPYASGLPESFNRRLLSVMQVVSVFNKHREAVDRDVGVTDRDSWLNNWRFGRTSIHYCSIKISVAGIQRH